MDACYVCEFLSIALLTSAQITMISLGISTRSIELLIPPTVSSICKGSSSLILKQEQEQEQEQKQKQTQKSLISI